MSIKRLLLTVGGLAALAAVLTGMLVATGSAQSVEAAGAAATDPGVAQWAMIAAALAAGMATIGAGIAVAAVGSAAVGALAEKPDLLGRVLIIVGLAEGIAIYGLIVAILILNRVG